MSSSSLFLLIGLSDLRKSVHDLFSGQFTQTAVSGLRATGCQKQRSIGFANMLAGIILIWIGYTTLHRKRSALVAQTERDHDCKDI